MSHQHAAQYVPVDDEGVPLHDGCAHLPEILEAREPHTDGCVDCLREGSQWVHLRQCLTCGGVHCCDSSPRQHATAHWRGTGHPLIVSVEPGEEWAWCYVDQVVLAPEA